ncbi:beta-lactamase family protein [Myxococcaceae bacterium JPH2]|nr:beta-lactamase family protein [Myxococcaceae bacterium JPH2]
MHRLRPWVVMFALYGFASAAAPAPSVRDQIDTFVRAELAKQHIPGLGIGVVSHGKVILVKGYGFANLEHDVRVEPRTLFQSGSLGKQFTAMTVMLQVEAGKLALSDSVKKFFPDAPASWDGITVRHLLTHTSGIADLEGLLDPRKDFTDEELARFIYTLPIEFPVGTRWHYSNTGYDLLGIIVNRVAGTSYLNVLRDQVFRPAGMTTARGISEDDVIPHRASGYRLVNGEVKNQEWVAPSLNTTADGSLYVSVQDLLAWDAAVQRRAILKPESWKEILTPVRLVSGATYPYGFGWEVKERGGQPLHQHTGAWQGFTSAFARYLGDSLSIVVLANSSEAHSGLIAEGIAAIVNPALGPSRLSPIEDHEPQVTARLTTLLGQVRAGTLDAKDFAYVRASMVQEIAKAYQAYLKPFPPEGPLVLAERTTVGDDRVYTYMVAFGPKTLRYSVTLTPDDRIASLRLREK